MSRSSNVLAGEDIPALQELVRRVPISDHTLDYALALVRATRTGSEGPAYTAKWIAWGAGPRAGQVLILAAKAKAALDGRTSATIDDIRAVAHPVLRHRLVTTYSAQAEGQTPDTIITRAYCATFPLVLDSTAPMATSLKYSDPEVLAAIADLMLRARQVAEGTISGLHRSPFHGFNVEFAEYREYSPGDDLRRLDWRVLGRTDRYYIKQYEEESNLRATLVMDCSASMRDGSKAMTKFDYGATVAASLATLLVSQQDPVGLVLFDAAPIRFCRRRRPRPTWCRSSAVCKTRGPIAKRNWGRCSSRWPIRFASAAW